MEDYPTALPVEFLFKINIEFGPFTAIGKGPQGQRLVFPVTSGSFEGPRLRGTVEGPSGDWLTLREDGSGKLDVRSTLKTDDGALILVTYTGIMLPTKGGSTLRSTPLFETGDERYQWLNRVQAVGIGVGSPRSLSYDVFALK